MIRGIGDALPLTLQIDRVQSPLAAVGVQANAKLVSPAAHRITKEPRLPVTLRVHQVGGGDLKAPIPPAKGM